VAPCCWRQLAISYFQWTHGYNVDTDIVGAICLLYGVTPIYSYIRRAGQGAIWWARLDMVRFTCGFQVSLNISEARRRFIACIGPLRILLAAFDNWRSRTMSTSAWAARQCQTHFITTVMPSKLKYMRHYSARAFSPRFADYPYVGLLYRRQAENAAIQAPSLPTSPSGNILKNCKILSDIIRLAHANNAAICI